ncbi:MAG TPA: hypothetical protein H9671_07220 [Firmicutes bacterium]|nr:hypothetical protein [Bacillota bacterium]
MEEYLCLTDLLDNDLTSYEYFYALTEELQEEIRRQDLRSFQEMQAFAESRQQS